MEFLSFLFVYLDLAMNKANTITLYYLVSRSLQIQVCIYSILIIVLVVRHKGPGTNSNVRYTTEVN